MRDQLAAVQFRVVIAIGVFRGGQPAARNSPSAASSSLDTLAVPMTPFLPAPTLHFGSPGPGRWSCQPPVGRCLSGAAGGGVPMTAPACARAAGSRRDLIRLATVVAASTPAMTASDTAVVISGTRGLSP